MPDWIFIILSIIYLFGIPLFIIQLSHRWAFINKISPMLILYCIGLVIGNTIKLPDATLEACNWVANIAVLIAIPLMLMSCNFKHWSTKTAIKAFLTGLGSVLFVIITGYFLFYDFAQASGISHSNYAKISGVMTGIYTGGIPNIGAISKAVDLPNNLYLLITSYDLIVTGLYLLFVIFLGKGIFRKLLPCKQNVLHSKQSEAKNNSYKHLLIFGKKHRKKSFVSIGIACIIAFISYGISLLIPTNNTIAILILVLTTLSISISFYKPLQKLQQSFDIGLYFVYVFCLSIATLVNIHDLNWVNNLFILYYIVFTIFGSLCIQILLAKIFKIDGDTVLITSIALINSPPFVPLVAATLNNKDVVLTGISIGLLGYAIANYLGIGIFELFNIMVR